MVMLYTHDYAYFARQESVIRKFICVYGEHFHRLRVDGRPKRIKKFAFTSVCVYNRLRVDGVLASFPRNDLGTF